MVDAQIEQKRLGRNQRFAAKAYGVVGLSVVIPALAMLASALVHNDSTTQLAVLDRLISFAQGWGLWAVGSVLVVSGAIKGLGSVAGAISGALKKAP
jgi:hypothetical protein